jgi:hypothetical protein
MAKRKVTNKKDFSVKHYVLNCVPSTPSENDWTFEDAVDAGVVDAAVTVPSTKDLRANWWKIDDQGMTGACVGFATAYGVLRWHFIKEGKISKKDKPSARFIWMANKETDDFIKYPTTFLDSVGTKTKLALRVAQRYGCVLDKLLPMDVKKGKLCTMKGAAFYAKASRLRISSYHSLGRDLDKWRRWLAYNGPILTRLGVDKTWLQAKQNGGKLDRYLPNTVRGGHAVCLVGYSKNGFIVRNSWGKKWGDKGFAYASNQYAQAAFTEAYGAVV